MKLHSTWVSCLTATLLVGFSSTVGKAEPPTGNLLGQNGVLRSSAATPLPSGWLGFGSDFQYYKSSDLAGPNQDHSRMVNGFFVNWAMFRFLEAAFAFHVTSDNDTTTSAEELQVAVGDPELSIKGGAELGKGFSVGGLLDLRFLSAAGFFNTSISATNVYFAGLGSWTGGSSLPLGVHVNLGFLRDGSANLFDDLARMTSAQRFAAQVSSFNRLVARLGLEYLTSYVGPFLELSLEPYLGDGAPGFGRSPGLLSLGARVWPTKEKRLQLLAALDVGITGVGDGTSVVTAPDKYAFAIPRWNLLFQLSYRFDPFAEPETKVVREGSAPSGTDVAMAAKMGVVTGKVLDDRTDKPIWNARISLKGDETSSLAVDPQDGSFRTYKLPAGAHTLVATADGYGPTELQAEVTADGKVELSFKLTPRSSIVPGTLRGTVTGTSGKQVSGATVLIPEIDRSIEVGADGSFTVSLKPGEYKVVISAAKFRTQQKLIRIQEGSTVILNVELHR